MTVGERVKKILDLQAEVVRTDNMIVAYMAAIDELENLKSIAVATNLNAQERLEAALAGRDP